MLLWIFIYFLFQTLSLKNLFQPRHKTQIQAPLPLLSFPFSSVLFIICSLRTKKSFSIIRFSWGEENLPAASRTWPGYQRTNSNNPETDLFFYFFLHNYTLTVFFPFRCTSKCHFLPWLQSEEHDRLILAFRANRGDIYLPHFTYSKSIGCHWWPYILSITDLPLFESNCRLIRWLMPWEIQT